MCTRQAKQIFFFLLCSIISFMNAQMPQDWQYIKNTDLDYYYGIGNAPMNYNTDYIQIAKSNALKDLKSEISVTIFSKSKLKKEEQNNIYTEEFKTNVRLDTDVETIEGYELLNSYNDGKFYWVFYRLSKKKYQENKLLQIQKTIYDASGYYNMAVEEEGKRKIRKALTHLNQTLVLLYQWKEDNVFYKSKGFELYRNAKKLLFQILQQTTIETEMDSLAIQSSEKKNRRVLFTSFYQKVSLPDLPIIVKYKSKNLTKNAKTDINGKYLFLAPRLFLNKDEKLTVQLDIESLLDDSIITDMYLNNELNTAEITKDYAKMLFCFEENYFDQNSSEKFNPYPTAQDYFTTKEYEFTTFYRADYKMKIQGIFNKHKILRGELYNYTEADMDVTITCRDSDGELLFEKAVTNINTTQFNALSKTDINNKLMALLYPKIEQLLNDYFN